MKRSSIFGGISQTMIVGLVTTSVAITSLGCARTVSSSEPSAAGKVIGSEAATPQTSGFLKDYSQP